MNTPTLAASQQAVALLDDGVEHRLQIDGELAITFRTSAVAVCRSSASLRLVEQPRVLDGDHGLIGEGLQQAGS